LLIEKICLILQRSDFKVQHFEDGILWLTRGAADEKNREILSFIDENKAWLSRNLTNPYQTGPRPRPEALKHTFGPSMLPSRDQRQ